MTKNAFQKDAEAKATIPAQTDAPDQPGADTAAQAAEAEAKAEAAATEAAAQAEADRLAAEEAAKTEAPALNLDALTYCARQIDMLNTSGHRLGLVGELEQLYGAKVFERDGEGVTVQIEGITTEPADTLENALTNWANAARRAIHEATA